MPRSICYPSLPSEEQGVEVFCLKKHKDIKEFICCRNAHTCTWRIITIFLLNFGYEDGIVMIGMEIPNLITLSVTKSSQYLYIWSGGFLLLLKCKCISLNLRSPPLNQLLSHFNDFRPFLFIYGHFYIISLSVSKSSGWAYTSRFSDQNVTYMFSHRSCWVSAFFT
jgi:hypothetical protein